MFSQLVYYAALCAVCYFLSNFSLVKMLYGYLLVFDTLKISRLTPTFRINVLPPVDICLDEITSTLKMGAARSSETSILPYEFIRYQNRSSYELNYSRHEILETCRILFS